MPIIKRVAPYTLADSEMLLMLGDRILALTDSKKDGGKIVIMCTPLFTLGVIDADAPCMAPPDAIGYSVTTRGRHYYVPTNSPSLNSDIQDPAYLAISLQKGHWAERLFDKDGTPRPLPVNIANPRQKDLHNLMASHIMYFEAFQREAKKRKLTKPTK